MQQNKVTGGPYISKINEKYQFLSEIRVNTISSYY